MGAQKLWLPWRPPESKAMPWHRDDVGRDFMAWEAARVKESAKWLTHLNSENVGKPLPETRGYHVPAKTNAIIQAWARQRGYNVGALSALYTQPSATVPLFFTGQQPPQYAYIHISDAHLTVVQSEGLQGMYGVVVEKWEKLNPLLPYQLIEADPGVLRETLNDHTGLHPFLIEDLLLPLYSSQPLANMAGGNHTLGTSGDIKLRSVSTALDSLQSLLPAELRGIKPPAGLLQGAWTPIDSGFEVRSAQRAPRIDHRTETIRADDLGALIAKGHGLRGKAGEFGAYGAVKPQGVHQRSEIQLKLRSMSKAESIIPQDYRDMVPDIDAAGIIADASDAHFADAARAHLTNVAWEPIMPHLDSEVKRLRDTLEESYVVHLYDARGITDHLNAQAGEMRLVLLRNAFARARSEGKNTAGLQELREAWRLYKANVEAFLEDPRVNKLSLYDEAGQKRRLTAKKRRNQDPRFVNVVKVLEQDGRSSESHIWEKVKDAQDDAGRPVFKQMADMIRTMDWGRENGIWTRSGPQADPAYTLV